MSTFACPGTLLLNLMTEPLPDREPGKSLVPVFTDPFNGKCVHGNEGARIVAGRLINPSCSECQKTHNASDAR